MVLWRGRTRWGERLTGSSTRPPPSGSAMPWTTPSPRDPPQRWCHPCRVQESGARAFEHGLRRDLSLGGQLLGPLCPGQLDEVQAREVGVDSRRRDDEQALDSRVRGWRAGLAVECGRGPGGDRPQGGPRGCANPRPGRTHRGDPPGAGIQCWDYARFKKAGIG